MTDELPEEVTLDGETLGSWRKLLVDRQVMCSLVVLECLAQNLRLLFGGQLQLLECILDWVPNRCQCSCGVGETCAFGMSGAQADFGDQL